MTRDDIRPFASDEDVEWSARVMADSEPWITLGRGMEASRQILSDAGKERSVAVLGGERAGFLVAGHSELLMRKTIGPLDGFVRRGR